MKEDNGLQMINYQFNIKGENQRSSMAVFKEI